MAEDTPTARPRLTHVVLGSPRPRELAEFYHRLLGWAYDMMDGDWVTLKAPEGAGLGFQLEDAHRRPVWPSSGDGAPSGAADAQQMQLHLDFVVDDLEVAVAAATGLGATVAGYQPQDDVRVMLDPDGHPFCLFT
ncbi:MAG: VOC family protein [Kineosporiaceae bacterium]